MMDKKYLNKHDVCEYVGVSIGKVELMMKEGLRYSKFGRNVRFDLCDIDEYMDRYKVS
jgi:excisionase family DNA binding protein|tara:strand:+ start:189 stop:362 length:174 start_codon:yes stop_codon:yes gene_type:complete